MEEIEIVLEKETNSELVMNLESEGKEIFPPLENLEVTPTKEQQVFNHENSYGYDEVIVEPIPDEYIIPDGTLDVDANGDVDVTMFRMARVGVYTPPTLQDKEITINENGTHDITYDEGYDGLNQVSVTVDAIEDLSEELETYNTELTEQETTINDIVETLKTKAIGGGEGMFNFSTGEQVVGTWVDGRPLYRQYINMGYLLNSSINDLHLSNYGIEAKEVQFFDAYKREPNGGIANINPSYHAMNGGVICRTILYQDENINVWRVAIGSANNQDLTTHTAYAIFYYTKASDLGGK